MVEGIAMGLEYYTGLGELGRTLPWAEQDNKVFVVFDIDRHPWVFNLGIGHGLTQAAEKTIVKMIFELPFYSPCLPAENPRLFRQCA